ncbi:hypothetical protein DFP72DRAFT_34729 [Ephemerocybe angulata]|uniref:Csf1 N-terminal domain-containing protein n=1 Tax=Ephemerocybe angulata TaxID=980116 RepID=A0A8H6I949_9AGAR|nr:hypothetical protein DFP72DRAFT_34729 [Tulosesus angulatus]
MLTRLLLVICICIIVALIIYFFYWNRCLAFIIGQLIRLLYWNQEASSIWVEIGSIHFSLLAGRILFKDFAYHSSNQTIKIVKGQIQWRYWIRVPTGEEDINSSRGEDVGKVKQTWMWCRIQLSLEGMEWFLYNRTAAYDNILSQMESLNRSSSRVSGERLRPKSRQDAASTYPPSTAKHSLRVPAMIQNAVGWLGKQLPNLDPKDLLPLGIEVTTGAIILGNPSTPSLMVAEFHTAHGTFGVVSSRSKFDLYKQLLNLTFRNALVRLVENEDYADNMSTVGGLLHDRVQRYKPSKTPVSYTPYKAFTRLWKHRHIFRLVQQYFSERKEQRQLQRHIGSAKPSGKRKKVEEEETPIGIDFSTYEYAIERKILETPTLELTYYVDVVGEVPPFPHADPFSRGDIVDVGNGDTAPEWGFEIVITGGALRYGPWADRQRAELQKIFFPSTYQDVEVTQRLKPGDKRVWTALNVFIELRDETTMHVPFREPSKDWEWDGKSDLPRRPKRRENATIDLSIGDRSSINYVMPMVSGPEGYEAHMEVHLDSLVVTSSLNDIKLITSESCRVRCELPAPLQWNGERTWLVSISLRQPVLYLLRDHINMFTDLGKDWSSGPPTDWQKFIPMVYQAQIELHHYELNLYLNDHNIIDKPLLREENALLTARGVHLKADATIPSNKFRPMATSVSFLLSAPGLAATISVPRWNTYALHAPKDGHSFLQSAVLEVSGSYRYHSETREDCVDQLKLDFKLSNTALKALGWAIRYFMVLKDNYFGSFTHFSTLYEYLDNRKKNTPLGDPIMLKYRPGKHNMLQVEMVLAAEDVLITLPAGLLGYQTSSTTPSHQDAEAQDAGACLLLYTRSVQLDLRLHDFFMEMSLNVDPLRGYIDERLPEKVAYSKPPNRKPLLFIDGLDVVANRLFGPLPRTATYLCIWEISVGAVSASVSASEAKILGAVGNAFRVHFVDHVNAPAEEYMPPLESDITFYKVSIRSLDVTWKAGSAALVITLPEGIKINTNDLAADHYRKVISIKMPQLTTKVLVTSQFHGASWLEAGELVADAYVDVYSAPQDYLALNAAQVAFVEEQDRPTDRVKRMIAGLQGISEVQIDAAGHHNGVFVPQPMLPCMKTSSAPRPAKPDERRGAERPMNWRSMSNVSDSEEDEGMSEVDRDARVASSRFSKAKPVPHDEDFDYGMSSGDESDDADLTDGDSLNSDWFDMADSPTSRSDAALLAFYAPLTRHYVKDESHPNAGASTSFTLARDKPNLNLKGHGDETTADQSTEPSSIFIPEETKRARNTTVVRVRTLKQLGIRVTPLLSLAYTYFEEDIQSMSEDQEMVIDSLMARHMSKILSEVDGPSCLLFDVQLSSIRATLIHHIPLLEEQSIRANIQANSPSKMDSTAIVDVNVDSLSLTGCTIDETPMVELTLKRLSSRVDISIDKRTLLSVTPSLTILDASISNLSSQLSNRSLNTHAERVSVDVGHRGPEVMALIGLSLQASGTELSRKIKHLSDDRQHLTHNIVGRLLESSESRSILDTLSTIQPSYLVQSGIPWRLRSDPIFRLLYHLRGCSAPQDVLHTKDYYGSDEFVKLLNSRLSALEQDDVTVDDFPQLHDLFPGLQDDHRQPKKDSVLFDTVGVQLDSIELSVLDPLKQATSELILRELGCQIRKDKLELIQFAMGQPTSMSQTSFRDQAPKLVRKWNVSVTLGESSLAVYPHLMPFIQHILRVRRQYFSDSKRPASPPRHDSLSIRPAKLINAIIVVSVRKIRLRAAAENLIFEFGIVGWQSSSTLLQSQTASDHSMNHAVLFEEIYLHARSPSNPAKESPQDVLAAITCQVGKVSALSRDETSVSRVTYRLVFSVNELRLDVPRSALRLYRFAEEWRADYLPGIEATIKSMLSEVGSKSPKPALSPPPAKTVASNITGSVGQASVVLQVMHGTWVTLEVHNTVAYARSPISSAISPVHTFGLQLSTIILHVSGKPGLSSVPPRSRVRLALPPISLAGHWDGTCIHTLALVEFIDLKVKPSHWDTLLAVQQKFGQDFNDLVDLMQKTRAKQPSSPKPAKSTPLQYGAFIKMKGFRIGLEGLSSTLSLECLDIRGGVNNSNGLSWDLALTGLTLSLAPRASGSIQHTRKQRSAFVTIDFKVIGSNHIDSESLIQNLDLAVTRVHAVMQPSSIGEVGDFIDHLQAEMLDRQERRSLELATFKEKTRTILETFDVKVRDVQLEETTNWLNNFVVNVVIQNVGVVFPLSNDDLQRQSTSGAVPAFLFSIRSIKFSTTRGETGQALMQRLCFQFVSRFNQTIPDDFTAEKHNTRNRLLYPEMKANLRSSTSSTSRKIWIDANVDGFVLDLDSTIPDYIFSLIDVYRQGKDRVTRLSATMPRTPLSAMPTFEARKPSGYDTHYTSLPTSNVFASLTFLSGKVRAYSASASRQLRARSLSNPFQELTDEQVLDVGAEVFNLPVVSVWAEYRATPAARKLSANNVDQEPSLLLFKSTVHSSRNTLRPQLLPFVTEVIGRVETRMRKISARSPPPQFPTSPRSLASDQSKPFPSSDSSDPVSSMQLSFSLRIDKSRLELTCQPDVNVVAALNWESGGFIVNVSPGARQVSFTGSVAGLSIGLKHGFLSEECVNLDARNLSFSVTFDKTDVDGEPVSSISAILDTEFLGGVRFSRLQDILCFKAVWLDRIPVFKEQARDAPKASANGSLDPSRKDQGLSILAIVRIRQIKLTVDLGQSITSMELDLKNAVLRSKMTDAANDVSVFVEDVSISGTGNLSGHIRVPDCLFNTVHRKDTPHAENGDSQMLELKMTSGTLIVALESDHQKLLHYRAEPLEVMIFDDWSQVNSKATGERPLQLSFTVNSPEIVMVATVSTIPKMMSYINKFKTNVDVQRQAASRESKTYWATRTPNPENPLSAVAEAMLDSARSRFRDFEPRLTYLIRQNITLRLDLLRLVVFPRSMNDVEIAQFIGTRIKAQLNRLVATESQPGKRDLRLSFSSMAISKHTHNHPDLVPPTPLEGFDGRDWLEAMFKDSSGATIIGLPSMKMHMLSEERFSSNGERQLIYDFDSVFIRQEGMKAYEDIFITLNMSLYAWLTLLRKNLTREMAQVRATEDWRTSLTVSSPNPNAPGIRKKVPEPLDLGSPSSETPRSATLPAAGPPNKGFLSPLSAPSSARYPSIEQAARAVLPQAPRSASVTRPTPSLAPPLTFPAPAQPEAGSPDFSPLPSGASTAALATSPSSTIIYQPRERHIERLTMRQLGEATPDVMHPFFMKKAGFNLEDSLPQYVHEYATIPLEEIMEVLFKLYSQQLLKKQEAADPSLQTSKPASPAL